MALRATNVDENGREPRARSSQPAPYARQLRNILDRGVSGMFAEEGRGIVRAHITFQLSAANVGEVEDHKPVQHI